MRDIIISDHARYEIVHRQLSEAVIIEVVQNPQQVVKLSRGRIVCQSKYYDFVENKEMLMRVIYEEKQTSLFVVTAYRTSKIDKYWEGV